MSLGRTTYWSQRAIDGLQPSTRLQKNFAIATNLYYAFESFGSYRRLLKEWGSAGSNYVWHHVVEQSKLPQFSAEEINNITR
jgi:hypothetical protein